DRPAAGRGGFRAHVERQVHYGFPPTADLGVRCLIGYHRTWASSDTSVVVSKRHPKDVLLEPTRLASRLPAVEPPVAPPPSGHAGRAAGGTRQSCPSSKERHSRSATLVAPPEAIKTE